MRSNKHICILTWSDYPPILRSLVACLAGLSACEAELGGLLSVAGHIVGSPAFSGRVSHSRNSAFPSSL